MKTLREEFYHERMKNNEAPSSASMNSIIDAIDELEARQNAINDHLHFKFGETAF